VKAEVQKMQEKNTSHRENIKTQRSKDGTTRETATRGR